MQRLSVSQEGLSIVDVLLSQCVRCVYRHAVQLAPNSGQPYNQLALLEASRGDHLSTVFHYVRSVAVRHFFPAAATNLSRTLNKSAEEQ
jgi:protein SMG7